MDSFGHPIRIRRRRGLRMLRLAVASDGHVTVSAARLVPFFLIKRFVDRQRAWIVEHQNRFHEMGYRKSVSPEKARLHFEVHREAAKALIETRMDMFRESLGVTETRLTIRDTRTRWGSCSARGALSFNYRLMFLPIHLVDYVVVHELCHLRELNHSSRFWNIVESILPDYQSRRRALKLIRLVEIGK